MGGDRSSPEFQFAQPNGRNKLRAVAQHAAGWTRKRPDAVTRRSPRKQTAGLAASRSMGRCRQAPGRCLHVLVRLRVNPMSKTLTPGRRAAPRRAAPRRAAPRSSLIRLKKVPLARVLAR